MTTIIMLEIRIGKACVRMGPQMPLGSGPIQKETALARERRRPKIKNQKNLGRFGASSTSPAATVLGQFRR